MPPVHIYLIEENWFIQVIVLVHCPNALQKVLTSLLTIFLCLFIISISFWVFSNLNSRQPIQMKCSMFEVCAAAALL